MGRFRARSGAAVEIALLQLKGQPVRTLLVVVGVALAVLAATLLGGVGVGVLQVGEERFDAADRDLWVTGGPVAITPDGPGAVDNTIHDSHALAAEIDERDGVATAAPIGFQAVYVGTDDGELHLVTGVGIVGTHSGIEIRSGEALSGDSPHYADGSYDGEMTGEVLVDPRIAAMLDVEPGDSILVGGSESAARDREFTVVGVSPDYGRLLGTPTVTMHLGELQTVAGAAGTDRASLIAVTVEEGHGTAAVRAELDEAYPDHEVRTNREQLVAVVGENAVVVATAAALVVLAGVAGVALTANLLALSITSRRETLAALQAVGLSRTTLLGVVGVQGLILGLLGWAAAAAMTPLAAAGLDRVAAALVGYEGLVVVPGWLYAAGGAVGLLVGFGGAVVAGLLVTRLEPLRHLGG